MLNRIKAEFLNIGLKFMTIDDKIVRLFLESSPSSVNEIVILPAVKLVMKKIIIKLRNKQVRGRVYNGLLNDVPVSVIRSFMGCPNMAVTMEALKRTNARIIIRIDFCGAISENDKNINIGDTLIPKLSYCGDGTSPHYINIHQSQLSQFKSINNPLNQLLEIKQGLEKIFIIESDAELRNTLIDTGALLHKKYVKEVNIFTTDALFCETSEFLSSLNKVDIQAIDMETSILFLLSRLYGIKAASILSVSDLPGHPKFDLFKSNQIHPEMENGIDRTIKILMESLPKINEIKEQITVNKKI